MKKTYLSPQSEALSSLILKDLCGDPTGSGTFGSRGSYIPEGTGSGDRP